MTSPHTISQICIVTWDLEKTMHEYAARLGWGPWNINEYKPPMLHDTYLHGEPEKFEMIIAETRVNGLGFELIQPTRGRSIYREFLEERGEGVQHIAVMKHNAEDSRQLFNDLGATISMSGKVGDATEFFYLDTSPTLKITIESGTGHGIDELKPDSVFSLSSV